MRVAGAVLCGGSSRRMGRDKALLAVDGVPMAARVAGALAAGGCAPVVAVGGDGGGLRAIGLDVEPDLHPGEGPLGGIITALTWSPAPWVVVAACDLPWLSAEVVRALVAAATDHSTVVVANSGARQPLCACWPVAALDNLRTLYAAGERAVRDALARLDVRDLAVDAAPLRNANTPDDLPRSG